MLVGPLSCRQAFLVLHSQNVLSAATAGCAVAQRAAGRAACNGGSMDWKETRSVGAGG